MNYEIHVDIPESEPEEWEATLFLNEQNTTEYASSSADELMASIALSLKDIHRRILAR